MLTFKSRQLQRFPRLLLDFERFFIGTGRQEQQPPKPKIILIKQFKQPKIRLWAPKHNPWGNPTGFPIPLLPHIRTPFDFIRIITEFGPNVAVTIATIICLTSDRVQKIHFLQFENKEPKGTLNRWRHAWRTSQNLRGVCKFRQTAGHLNRMVTTLLEGASWCPLWYWGSCC